MVFPDRKRRHHSGCPDCNVSWIKIHSKNDQRELALVSKLSTITLKNAGWCQATQETSAPDNTHGNFIPISSRQEVEEGPLETKNNHQLLNLSEFNPHFEVHQKTTRRYKSWEKEIKGNHHHLLPPAKRQALQLCTTPSHRSYTQTGSIHQAHAKSTSKAESRLQHRDNSTQDRSARPCSLLD